MIRQIDVGMATLNISGPSGGSPNIYKEPKQHVCFFPVCLPILLLSFAYSVAPAAAAAVPAAAAAAASLS